MKLERLDLIAFGPFSDVQLDLAAPTDALHLIYGSNEAGKSTTLRAIMALFFGIPVKTPDAHRHGYAQLRVGGRLVNSQGASLDVVRRKGQKATLRAADDSILDDLALEPFLRGVSEPVFRTTFGLDHRTLREGAEAMLAGRGEIGQSLFGAGVGGAGIRRLLEELEAEANKLFTPRGREKKVNQALAELRAAKERLELRTTPGKKYREQQRALEALEQQKKNLGERRDALTAEQRKLQRLLDLLPRLATRRELILRSDALGELPRLDADASEQRHVAERALADATREAERLELEVSDLRARHDGLEAPEALLGLDPRAVDELRQRVSRAAAARIDLPKRRGEVSALKNEASQALRLLRSDGCVEDAEELRIGVGRAALIRELSTRRGEIASNLRNAEEQTALRRKRRERYVAELAGLSRAAPLEALEQSLGAARLAGELDDAGARAEAAVETLRARASALEGVLGIGGSPRNTILALIVPAAETVEQLAAEQTGLFGERSTLTEERQKRIERLAELERQLDELRLEGDVPTEAQLAEARSERDACWSELRPAIVQGATTAGALDGYERAARRADELADRLRREATRAARLAALLAEQSAAVAGLERLTAQSARLEQALVDWTERWHGLWKAAGVAAREPSEMRAWLRRHAELVETLHGCQAAEEQRDETRRLRARRLADLASALEEHGVALASEHYSRAIAQAEGVLSAARAVGAERSRAERQIAETGAEIAELEQQCALRADELAAWKRAWADAVAPLGLAAEASPDQAQAVVEAVSALLRRVDQAHDIERRIAAMERDVDALGALESTLAEQAFWQRSGELSPETAAEQLLAAYDRARRNADDRRALAQTLAQKRQTLGERRHDEKRARDVLERLLSRAGVDTLEALRAVEVRAAEALAIRAQLSEVEERLLRDGGGATIEDLIEQTRDLDGDRAKARLDEIARELAEHNDEIERLSAEISKTRVGLEHLVPGAAEPAEDVAAIVARLRSYVDRYVHERVAAIVLLQEIERYRERNQGPLLRRAGELFQRLTLGSFNRLAVNMSADDRAVIVCVRPDGREVDVEGLSEGTRDQLYLALRLASLERLAGVAEVPPVVLDDVLIHADDERARAALEVLGDVSRRIQVLFFTHHRRIVELATGALPKECLRVHRLGGASGEVAERVNEGV